MLIDMGIVALLMDKDKVYTHCAWHGMIYHDSEYKIPLIKVSIPLSNDFRDYKLTSGLCNDCFEKNYMKEKYSIRVD